MQDLKLSYREARDVLQGKVSYAQIAADKQNDNIPTQQMEIQKKQESKGHQMWFGGMMANKRKMMDSMSTQRKKEFETQRNEIINFPYGRGPKTIRDTIGEST